MFDPAFGIQVYKWFCMNHLLLEAGGDKSQVKGHMLVGSEWPYSGLSNTQSDSSPALLAASLHSTAYITPTPPIKLTANRTTFEVNWKTKVLNYHAYCTFAPNFRLRIITVQPCLKDCKDQNTLIGTTYCLCRHFGKSLWQKTPFQIFRNVVYRDGHQSKLLGICVAVLVMLRIIYHIVWCFLLKERNIWFLSSGWLTGVDGWTVWFLSRDGMFVRCSWVDHFIFVEGQRLTGVNERKGQVPCSLSVTGFSLKLVFNLAKHPTLL